MHIIFLGPPGSGKGTQSQFLSKHFHIPIISTGDILRAAIREKSDIGLQVKKKVESGLLAPDEVVIGLLKKRIQQPDCKNGFLLDGFPRTIVQADELKKFSIDIDAVIEVVLSDDEILKRMTGRRIHPTSGRIYHLIHHPPKVPDRDDITGEPLVQREDDKPESVLRRLKIYHRQTEPIIEYYHRLNQDPSSQGPRLFKIDARKNINEVREQLIKIFKIKN